VAATLCLDLVFYMHRSRTELYHRPDRPGDIESAAPSGVDVHEHRKIRDIGNAPYVGEDVVHGADAEVRNSERTGGNSAAG